MGDPIGLVQAGFGICAPVHAPVTPIERRPWRYFHRVTSGHYQRLSGNLHRHGLRVHDHAHGGPHTHERSHRHRGHDHRHDRGHSHGLIDPSIKRSREGLRAVGISLAVLGIAALAQAAIFVLTNSVALLADLIHNFGDALTAIPVGIAFLLRSERAERIAGLFVVATIFISACVAGYEAVRRLIEPEAPSDLGALAAAGVIGFGGNWVAARIRSRAGHRLSSPALVADGDHARADAYVSLAVIASAIVVALGLDIADPLIGLTITAVILRITWQSWNTVRHGHAHVQ
jgi:Co/Zn/Cd efflux system component